MVDCSAASCVRALLRTWICRYGVPDHIVSDRGAQFTSHLWGELSRILGIKHQTTTSYHPQANGLIERFHRHLKGALKARLSGPSWMDELPVALLGIRAAWREDADTTPAQLLYGTALRLPGEMIPEVPAQPEPSADFLRSLQDSMRAGIPVPVQHHQAPRSYVPDALSAAKAVYLRHDARRLPLQRPYDGPFAVIERGEKTFIISRNGSPQTVSIDRLKPAMDPIPPLDPTPGPPTTAPRSHRTPRQQPRDPELDPEAPLRPITVTRSGRISKPPIRL